MHTNAESKADLVDRKKISESKKVKFWLGDPDPQIWGQSPFMARALYKDPRVVPNAIRTIAISAAGTEIIAIKK